MSSKNSITIVVPALNEQHHLGGAVDAILQAVQKTFDEYEILIFNDGSTDETGKVADQIATQYPCVSTFHHEQPRCLGGVIRRGLRKARMEYFMWVDGKGATSEQALLNIFSHRHEAEAAEARLALAELRSHSEITAGDHLPPPSAATLRSAQEEAADFHIGLSIEGEEQDGSLDNLRTEYRRKIDEARDEMLALRSEARKQALDIQNSLLDEAKKEAGAELGKAEKELAGEAAKVRDTLSAEARVLAATISHKVLGRAVQ